ncbi:MAG: hypothetical protein DWQ07_11035 [Chloroflexi bacterium]|nr:MAG: hypothetical protein DWQ07_11035 [Chloroflexota bacterium]MBL1192751.1 hypothetical protein [Chloroflexota bacterium]NOH10044.1 hypothetical protein [Chloroflexota bacterium]
MKVLIVSANTLPAAPSGPAYAAGAALKEGHTVKVFEALFAQDLTGELKKEIITFAPDVVGISIRLVHGYVIDEDAEFGTKYLDLRVRVKEIVEFIKQVSNAQIILGGPGFNYFGPDWLEYLDLDYSIRGEAEQSLPQFLERLGSGEDIHSVPGCVFRQNGAFGKVARKYIEDLDATAFPAYELFDLGKYYEQGICLWSSHQKVLEDARADGQLTDDAALFQGATYMSPQLPRDYMIELVESLRKKEGYTVQVNKLYADHQRDK